MKYSGYDETKLKKYKYAVTHKTKYGGRSVLQLFKTKAQAEKQVSICNKSAAFKKLGYSDVRVKKLI